jgi:hypothetical protein
MENTYVATTRVESGGKFRMINARSEREVEFYKLGQTALFL